MIDTTKKIKMLVNLEMLGTNIKIHKGKIYKVVAATNLPNENKTKYFVLKNGFLLDSRDNEFVFI
jgi:hypothetical protein